MMALFRRAPTAQERAQQRLADMVAEQAASPEIVRYREKREAAAKLGKRVE